MPDFMYDSSAALFGLAGGMLVVTILISVTMYVLQIIGWWKLFTKAGEAGWKSLIPLYNLYVICKISCAAKYFWYLLLTAIASGIFSAIGGTIGGLLVGVCSILSLVLFIMVNYKLAKAYGHGGGYTLGLLFFPWLFILILGFGSSAYQGNAA